MTVSVRDNPIDGRHESTTENGWPGFRLQDTSHQIAFTHTETDPAFSGRGLARRLVIEALDDARRRKLAVLPFCPYVRKVIAQDTARYLDLFPQQDHDRFTFANDTAG